MSEVATSESDAELIARLRRENAALSAQLVDARQSLARLRSAYNKALEELHLLKHRLFVAKAERRDTTQEQLAFDNIERTVKSLAEQLHDAEDDSPDESESANEEPRKRRKASARRALIESDLPLVRIELRDETLDESVECIGFEPVQSTARDQREEVGRRVGVVVAATDQPVFPAIRDAPQSTLGGIVVAMSEDAKKNAFWLSTDATGVSIQPGSLQERERGPCRKGHFFGFVNRVGRSRTRVL